MLPVLATETARRRARVTVVTRTKDRPLMLQRCVGSVLGQTFPDWLHVIVNDGGNPHLVRLLVAEHAARYAGRVEIIDHAIGQGMQNASNRGLEAAVGDFVVIHDDDDSWEPDFLRAGVEFLDDAGPDGPVQGVITQTMRVLEEINGRGGIEELGREEYLPVKTIDLFAAGSDNPFAPIAFLYRRAVHETVGRFDERFSVVGDWDFNLRFLARYEIGVIDRRLANYHWRHRSGGSVYANTVTDGLDVHQQKSTELRNHYLREDLRAGRPGLGYLLNTSRILHGHSSLLWDARHRGDHAIHEVRKVQARLRKWEWFLTRNRRLKDTIGLNGGARPGGAKGGARGRARGAAPSCHAELAALFDGTRAEPPRVLSLDVFDTALLRTVRQPIDAFGLLAPAVRRQLGKAVADAAELPVAALRVAAERTARTRKLRTAGHEEVTLTEIYDAFCELAGADPAVHRERLAALETETEAALLYGNPAVLAAAAAAARAGVRVAFVSDMYLPRDFIAGQLRRAGFAVEDGAFFLSSEHGTSKHEGGLFDELLRELGVAPGEIVHVGDNLHSDVERAGERGLRTIHWDAVGPAPDAGLRPFVDQPPEAGAVAAVFAEDDVISSVCTGLVRRAGLPAPGHVQVDGDLRSPLIAAQPPDSRALRASNGATEVAVHPTEDALWDRLGYEVGGPLYFTFLHWLLQRAREEGLERLFFLARDGHYLRIACDLLTARAGLAVEAVDMAASRRLLNLPRVTALDHAALEFLLTPNPNLRVRHFLTRLGLDPVPLADKVRQAGFASLDEPVTTAGGVFRTEADHRAMRALFGSLEAVILPHAAAERARLLTYFDQIGFTPARSKTFAVVDLGWQASSARALQTLLNLHPAAEGAHRTLRAFYFGTWRFARTAVEAGCELSSFFFHLDKPAGRRELVSEAVELIELFFGAPHPTIVGLREGPDGRLEPIHGAEDHGADHLGHVARMRERAVSFVRDVAALSPAGDFLDWPGNGFGYLEATLERFLRHPTAPEARVLGALPARDSFGGSSPTRPLAQPPGRWERLIHPARLRDAYQHAFWKRGFLAQLSPREAARLRGNGG